MARKRKDDTTSSESSEEDESSSEEEEVVIEQPKRKARAPPRAAAARKKTKRVVEESEEEFGEAAKDEDDPGYGSDLFIDEEDKNYLNSLSEVDREQVLSGRYEKRQRWKEIKLIKESTGVAAAQKQSKPRQERRKAVIDSDDEDDYLKRPAPKRAVAKESAKPVVAAASKHAQRAAESEPESESEQDTDDDHESDAPSDDDAPATDRDQAITLDGARKILLSRKQLMDWMDEPAFKDQTESESISRKEEPSAILGCLIKIRLDENNNDSYGLRRIVGVDFGKTVQPYFVEKDRVLFQLKLRGGLKNKTVSKQITRISNSEITDNDFDLWKRQYPLRNMKNHVAEKVHKRLVRKLVRHVLTQEESLQRLETRKKRKASSMSRSSSLQSEDSKDGGGSLGTVSLLGASLVNRKSVILQELEKYRMEDDRLSLAVKTINRSKNQIMKQFDDNDEKDDDKVKNDERLFDDLDEAKKKIHVLELELSDVEKRLAAQAKARSVEAISKLNEQNWEKNRKVLLDIAQKTRSADPSKVNVGAVLNNPFMRRPTRPTMMWHTQKDEVGTAADDAAASISTMEGVLPAPTPSPPNETMSASTPAAVMETYSYDELSTIIVHPALRDAVQPAQVQLRFVDPSVVASTATKKFSLEEYRKLKTQQNR